MAARFSVIFVALVAVVSASVQAQQLQRLHVKSFTLTSDTARPRLEVPFNVTLTIRLAENVAQLQNVYLPAFVGPEELGDLREQSSGRSGTLYRETLRLVAHTRGPLTIGSAYLDAIDARDGKPKRFISNDLHLFVDGNPAANAPSALRAIAWAAFLAFFVAAAMFAFARVRKYRVYSAPEFEGLPVSPPIVPNRPSEFETALSQLRVRRDRDSVIRVRSALWRIAGACEGQTLADVLRRPEAVDEELRRMLIAVERAAFVEDRYLDGAIEAVIEQHKGSQLIR